jgi:hypothetical protein
MSSSTYQDHARRQEAAAREAHKLWWESLSPADRSNALALGLDTPSHDTSHSSGHAPGETRDAAESSRASTTFDYAAIDPSDAPHGSLSSSGFDSTMIQRVIGMLLIEQNVLISVAGLCFALNLDALNGLGSIREYAIKIGVSPEAISKKKRQWEAELGISSTTFGKTSKAKAALSKAQLAKHWRNKIWNKTTPNNPTHF